MIEEAVMLAERYDKNYSQRIRGATQEEILELEQRAGLRLSACHREFLSCMGHHMGGLQAEDVGFGLEEILDFYRSGDWLPPKGYILLGIHHQDPYLDYYLECSERRVQDCPVVRFPSEGEFSRQYFFPVDASLKDFLLAQVFIHKRMVDFESRWSFSSVPAGEDTDADPTWLAQLVSERAHKTGFEEIAQSSKSYRFFDRQDAAIYMRLAPEKGALVMTIAAKLPLEIERLGDILSHGTSLKRRK